MTPCDNVPSVNNVELRKMKALIIKPEPMRKILKGAKSWEIRRGRCLIRERIGLIESGSGTVVGIADLVDCVGPLTRVIRIRNAKKMGVTKQVAAQRWPSGLYAWVLAKRRPLLKPVPYKHPCGTIRWVPLSKSVERRIMRQAT